MSKVVTICQNFYHDNRGLNYHDIQISLSANCKTNFYPKQVCILPWAISCLQCSSIKNDKESMNLLNFLQISTEYNEFKAKKYMFKDVNARL